MYQILKTEKFINAKRRGAVEARRAHNPDVLGSKPSGAKLNFWFFFWCYAYRDVDQNNSIQHTPSIELF